MKSTMLVTGGAGFIGSNFIRYVFEIIRIFTFLIDNNIMFIFNSFI